MAHKVLSDDLAAEPPFTFSMERRRAPDRRVGWRGGRRDSDWRKRPDGALDRIADRAASVFSWRAWLKPR